MKIFVAYPYKFNSDGYREKLRARFEGTDVELVFADERLENAHVLSKIRKMMAEADTCMFDISESNPNVMLELGLAIGEGHPGFVVVRESDVGVISADVAGWDQLRYSEIDDLVMKLGKHIGRSALPLRIEAPKQSAFAADRVTDGDFFDQLFISAGGLIGQFDLVVHPMELEPTLVSRDALRSTLLSLSVSYKHNGIPTSIPFDAHDSRIENFVGGVQLVYQHPELSRYEAARLHTSGLFRMARVFREDYNEKGSIDHKDRELWIVSFIEQVTMFHLLARTVSRRCRAESNDRFHVEFAITGLQNRTPRVDDPCLPFEAGSTSHQGTAPGFRWDGDFSVALLEKEAIRIARARLAEVFWTFGIAESIIAPVQQRLLKDAEPSDAL